MRRSGLGVDLVEYKKAKVFYTAHQDRLKKFFDQAEVSFIQKSRKPHQSLALVLAAKEALFKSAGLGWMGTEGFRKTHIIRAGRPIPSLSFLKGKDYVVARCRPSARSPKGL